MPSTTDETHNGAGLPRKSVIVTGGASGIGLAITRHFASEGHNIAILDINSSSGPQIAAEIATEFRQSAIKFWKCDVSSWEEQAAVFKAVYEEHGNNVDIVVANAGISEQGQTTLIDLKEETPSEPRLKSVNINFVGVIYCELLFARPVSLKRSMGI